MNTMESNQMFLKCQECHFIIETEYVINGDILCGNCGLAQDVFIDTTAEWRNYNNNNNNTNGVGKERCGAVANDLLPNTQLNITIGGTNKRLQKIHLWNILSSKDRHLQQVHEEFEEIGAMKQISKNTTYIACKIYNELYEQIEQKNFGIKRCNVRLGLKAACFYFAFKRTDYPREKKEIAEILNYDIKIVTKGCNTFLDIMGGDYIFMNPFHATDFIKRFSMSLNLSNEEQKKLWEIVTFISEKPEFVDISPANITSGCLYFMSFHNGLGITKKMIQNYCGTSQNVITKTFVNINNYKSDINVKMQ